ALAGQARADAVAPPPDRCPTGSVPVELCHGAPTCRAHTCESDVECGAGMVCRATRLCTVEHCCSGQCCAIDCGSEPTTYTHVLGPCGGGPGDTPCADFGAACTEQRVCVPGTPDAGSGGADGGGSTAAD